MSPKTAAPLATAIILYAVFLLDKAVGRNPTPTAGLSPDKVTVCYVSSWAVYRPDNGKFSLDELDPLLCTHIVFAFAGLNVSESTIRSLDPYNDFEENYGKGTYKKITSLKNKFPHLTVTLAIGGWNEGSGNYSLMAADPVKRRRFVNSVVEFLKKYGFDGLDLDWEYPGKRGGAKEDKENFVKLVQDLQSEMDNNGWILTAALGAGKETIDVAYDLPALSKYLDYIHLMCYDYHGSWDKQVGANAPLKSSVRNDVLNVEYSVNYLLSNGVAPEKLVMGVPMYGRTFQLKDVDNSSNKLNEPTDEQGFQGPFTRENGFMGYNELCLELADKESWTEWWDEETQTPFARNKGKVISFDNPRSINEKVKFAMNKGLGGIMVWSIDTDDFLGNCQQEGETNEVVKFPLLRTINRSILDTLAEIKKKENEIVHKSKSDNASPDGAMHAFPSLMLIVISIFMVV